MQSMLGLCGLEILFKYGGQINPGVENCAEVYSGNVTSAVRPGFSTERPKSVLFKDMEVNRTYFAKNEIRIVEWHAALDIIVSKLNH